MALPSNVVEDLWMPPVAGALFSTLFLFRSFLPSDWRSAGLYSTLRGYGYTPREIAVAWLGIAACATGFLYAGLFIKYSDWLFGHQPLVTFVGIVLLCSLASWLVLLHRERTDKADLLLHQQLSGTSEMKPQETGTSSDMAVRYWGLVNLLLVCMYVAWIAAIISSY